MTYVRMTNSNINSGNPVYIHNAIVTYNHTNETFNKSIPGKFGTSEVHATGWKNPTFNLTMYMNTNDLASSATTGSTMTWAIWNDFLRQKPTSSNQTTIEITAGTQDLSLKSFAVSSTSTGVTAIPVVIKSSQVSFDTQDSNRAHFWTIRATLEETA